MGLKIAKVTNAKTSEEFALLAMRAYEARDLEKAAANLLSALELNDKDAQRFLELSAVMLELGRTDKALIAAKQAVELQPYSADGYNVVGVCLFQLKWFKTAERFFKRALQFNPEHEGARSNILECVRQIRNGHAAEEPPEQEIIAKLLETRPPTVALCMIVKNEEKYLEDCLESVQGAVDEICIVDTGSTDRTVEIARRFGAKVEFMEWKGDFATARNKSIDLATSDWILILDADETITPESIDEIKRISRDKSNIGYSCIIENLLGAKPGDGKQLAMIFRFFQNRPDMRYEGIIHEQALPAAQRSGMPNEISHIRIIHKGYLNGCVQDRDKYQRNLNILLAQLKEEPGNPYCHFNLGQTYKLTGKHAESEKHYREAMRILEEIKAENNIPYYASLYFGLTELLRNVGRLDEALDLANKGIERFPLFADIHFTRATVLLSMERYGEALKAYESCRKFANSVFAGGTDPGVPTYKTTNAIGVCYAKMGKNALAKQYFRRALKEWPNPNGELHTNLGVLYLQDGDYQPALIEFTTALEIDPGHLQSWFQLGTTCYKLGNMQEAIAAWLKAQELAPDMSDLSYLIGEAQMRSLSFAEAEKSFTEELDRRGDHVAAVLGIGVCAILGGDIARARQVWTEFLGNYPDCRRRDEMESALLFAQVASGQKTNATEAAATSYAPDAMTVQWMSLLDLAMQAHRFDEVERVASACLELLEFMPNLAESLGKFFFNWKILDLALEFLLRQQSMTPDRPELYFLLGETCQGLGNLEDAQVMYRACLNLNPRHAQARVRLARLNAQSA